jgi:hypothetical protein
MKRNRNDELKLSWRVTIFWLALAVLLAIGDFVLIAVFQHRFATVALLSALLVVLVWFAAARWNAPMKS